MAKPLGAPKTGGRIKGTPNKRSLDFIEILNRHNINLVEEILNELPQLAKRERINIYLQLLPFLYPKRKALDAPPPLSFEEQLEQLSIIEASSAHRTLGKKLGNNTPSKEHSLELLLATKKKIDDYIEKKLTMEKLKSLPGLSKK